MYLVFGITPKKINLKAETLKKLQGKQQVQLIDKAQLNS